MNRFGGCQTTEVTCFLESGRTTQDQSREQQFLSRQQMPAETHAYTN